MTEKDKVQSESTDESNTTETRLEGTTETNTESSVDHDKILKQVEFYFSDQNLPKDKFLWKATQENSGWVPISTIALFSRMRYYRPISEIVEALKKSENLLEVSEDNELIRRKVPLLEPKKEERQSAFARAIYAKGFPEETSSTQEEVEKFFESFGPINEVRLRRADDKKFKGSVFVEFGSLEDAQKFLALDPKPKFGEVELLTMSKQAYVDMKAAEHGFAANANGKRPKKFNAFREMNSQGHNQGNKRKDHYHGQNHYQNKRRKQHPRGPNDRNKEREENDKQDNGNEQSAKSDAKPETKAESTSVAAETTA